jgi:hypothetical protein
VTCKDAARGDARVSYEQPFGPRSILERATPPPDNRPCGNQPADISLNATVDVPPRRAAWAHKKSPAQEAVAQTPPRRGLLRLGASDFLMEQLPEAAEPGQAVIAAGARRQSLSRLWVVAMSFHSAAQAARHRRWKRSMRRRNLVWANTDSTICCRRR